MNSNTDLTDIVENICHVNDVLYDKLTRSQSNLYQIKELINQWNNQPLFIRNETNGLIHDSNWESPYLLSIVNKR